MIKRQVVATLVFVVCVIAGVAEVSAQGGRYANVYSRTDIDSFISSLENSSDTFSRDFKNASGTSTTERRTVDRFENAVDRLRRNFNSGNNWWASRNDVQGMMGEARSVNVLMNNERFARRLESQWRNLRRDINKLADTYELPELTGGGWNPGGGGWNPGGGGGGFPGGGGNVPNWAVGTFYGRNPSNGGTITMNIASNGNVTIDFGGGVPTYASLNNRTLRVGGVVSRISRLDNGIRTARNDTGEVIDYFRDGGGGGGGGWNPGGGGGGNVPSWARGTFYARNPQNGGRITLIIDDAGSATVRFGTGAPDYGTVNGTIFNYQGSQARISRINNGIRMTRTDNGEVIDYYRTLR